MKHHFIPHQNHNYNSFFNSKNFLFAFALIVGVFNFGVSTNVGADSYSNAITHEQLLTLHNEERARENIGALVINEELNISAQNKANEMLRANCWSHYCPDGKQPWEFFEDAGYDFTFAGENLAEGFFDSSSVMQAWMNSPTHKENVLKNKYTEVGFGIVSGNFQGFDNNLIVVVHFGARLNTQVPKELILTKPLSNQVVTSGEVDIEGKVKGFDTIEVVANGNEIDTFNVQDGDFTYQITLEEAGAQNLYVEGRDSTTGITQRSNTVDFNYQEVLAQEQEVQTRSQGFVSLDKDYKNAVNIGFIVVLAAIFIVDFLVIKYTHAIKLDKSFAHYHVALIVIIVMSIFTGGVIGEVGKGIAF